MSATSAPEAPRVEPETSAPAAPAESALPLAELLKREAPKVPEIGGRQNGLDPTRYGDWEKDGRCIDF